VARFVDETGVSPGSMGHRIVADPAPSWLRRHLGAVLVLGPLGAGLLLSDVGGWQFRGGLEAGGGIAMVAAAVTATVRMIRRDPTLARVTRYDLTRHRWLWIPLLALFAGVAGFRSVLVVGDWISSADRMPVTIVREIFNRFATEFRTDRGSFQTPWLMRIDAKPGPAIITIGHVSGELLRIEQPPPSEAP
jgi:hypothetical protein